MAARVVARVVARVAARVAWAKSPRLITEERVAWEERVAREVRRAINCAIELNLPCSALVCVASLNMYICTC